MNNVKTIMEPIKKGLTYIEHQLEGLEAQASLSIKQQKDLLAIAKSLLENVKVMVDMIEEDFKKGK